MKFKTNKMKKLLYSQNRVKTFYLSEEGGSNNVQWDFDVQ